VRHYVGDSAGATAYYHEVLPMLRKLYGNVHPNVSTTLNNYGRVELEQSHIAEALPLLRESVELDRTLGHADHDDFVFSLNNLALAYRASGDPDAARPLLEEAAALAAHYAHSMWGPILADQADLQCAAGHPEGALALLDLAAERVHISYPEQPWRMAVVDSVRGECLSASGDRAGGERLLLASLPIIEAKWGKSALFTRDARGRIASHYERAGNLAVAQRYRAG
jgi:tetratricopeptide (TPR) repeat protein